MFIIFCENLKLIVLFIKIILMDFHQAKSNTIINIRSLANQTNSSSTAVFSLLLDFKLKGGLKGVLVIYFSTLAGRVGRVSAKTKLTVTNNTRTCLTQLIIDQIIKYLGNH